VVEDGECGAGGYEGEGEDEVMSARGVLKDRILG